MSRIGQPSGNGEVRYDVDVFMHAESTGLKPTDIIVHTQDGKPRFDWAERNGVWSQIPIVKP